MNAEERSETAKCLAEALALMCINRGISSVRGEKRAVRKAIAEAWRVSSGAERYPELSAFSIAGMVWDEMLSAPAERCSRAQWSGTAWLSPRSTSIDWSHDESMVSVARDRISAAELAELGMTIIAHFEDDDIKRGGPGG